jgi:hypothetical protein
MAIDKEWGATLDRHFSEGGLKMYVWHNVLTDYTSGMVCISAHNFEEAIEVAKRDFPTYVVEDFAGKDYDVYSETHGEYVYGGG